MDPAPEVTLAEDRPPRVAFVSHLAGLGGGAEKLLLELVTELARHRLCEPTVVVPGEGELELALRDEGIPVARAEYAWWCSTRAEEGRRTASVAGKQMFQALRRTSAAARNVAASLKPFRPQVIASTTCVTPAGAFAATKTRVPHVWLAQEHGQKDHDFTFFLGYGLSMRLLGANSAAVVAISAAVGRELERYTAPQKVKVLHAASLTPAGSPVAPRFAGEPLRLVLLGRGVPGKGTEDAIRAVGIARAHGLDVRLRIVGVGAADASRLRRLSGESGVSGTVEIVAPVNDVLAEIDRAHVGLTCSRWEAFGRVTVEYLRRGRPVIGTRSGGTLELVDDGVTGLLYEPGDCEGLASRIERLGSFDSTLEELSEAAIERSARRFLLSEYVLAFSEVLNRAQAHGPAWQLRSPRSRKTPPRTRR